MHFTGCNFRKKKSWSSQLCCLYLEDLFSCKKLLYHKINDFPWHDFLSSKNTILIYFLPSIDKWNLYEYHTHWIIGFLHKNYYNYFWYLMENNTQIIKKNSNWQQHTKRCSLIKPILGFFESKYLKAKTSTLFPISHPSFHVVLIRWH